LRSSSSGHKSPSVRLPTINLPIFDGRFTEWSRFKITFESLIIKNEGLDNIQKFHYLISSVRNEPRLLLQNLETSDENNKPDGYKRSAPGGARSVVRKAARAPVPHY
jgi:hypothetical protein